MEIRNAQPTVITPISNTALWTGRIISYLVILFLLFDAIMKVIKESHSIKGSVELGWPEQYVMGIGIILLVSTILYIIPSTAVLGAILITGYLGGAISIMLRVDKPAIFPLIFGVLVWAGLWFRDGKLRALIPFRKV